MSSIKRFIDHIQNYLEIYLAIVVSVTAMVIGLTPSISLEDTITKLSVAISAISGALVLYCFTALRERSRLNNIGNVLSQLQNQAAILSVQGDFDAQRHRLIEVAKKELYIFVRYGDNLAYEMDKIRKALERGVNIFYLSCSPNDDNIIQLLSLHADRNEPRYANPENAKIIISGVLESLHLIAKECNTESSGNLEIRTMKYLPPFVMSMCDPQLSSGEAVIAISNFRTPYSQVPKIKLKKFEAEEVFQAFYEEFIQYWKTLEIQG